MAHISDYIIKNSRPKKPVVILCGSTPELVTYFRRASDVQSISNASGEILSHAFTDPLFTPVSTLWVDGVPTDSDLQALSVGEIHQPVLFNLPEGIKEPELTSDMTKKIQVVSKGSLSPGGKPHKDLLTFMLSREFKMSKAVLHHLVEHTSPLFGKNFARGTDNLAKLLYIVPPTSLESVANLKLLLASLPQVKLERLLDSHKTPHIQAVVETLFQKSQAVYPSLKAYFYHYDSPLPLLKALTNTSRVYLQSAGIIKVTKGTKQSPMALAQGARIPVQDFTQYQAQVSKFFGEKILWAFTKDLCIIQSRYRSGEKSQLLLYNLIMRYIGVGL